MFHLMLKVPVKTRINAVTVDTPIKAMAGTVTFLSSSTMIMIIVANPSNASIISLMISLLLTSLVMVFFIMRRV